MSFFLRILCYENRVRKHSKIKLAYDEKSAAKNEQKVKSSWKLLGYAAFRYAFLPFQKPKVK